MTAGDKRRTRRFYRDALTEAEQQSLADAEQVEGFDEEIALLRLRLKRVMEKEQPDVALMLRGMDVLRRLVVARYGLSRADEAEMTSYMEETFRRLRERGGEEIDA